jgi:hypothetical protein
MLHFVTITTSMLCEIVVENDYKYLQSMLVVLVTVQQNSIMHKVHCSPTHTTQYWLQSQDTDLRIMFKSR